MKNIIIVDGDYLINRSFANPEIRNLSNSHGVPTGLVFNSIRILRNTLRQLVNDFDKINSIYFVLGNSNEYRRTIYPPYKANRAKTENQIEHEKANDIFGYSKSEHFAIQIPYLVTILEALKVRVFNIRGIYESDDYCYYFSIHHKLKANNNVIVVSDDKDYLQIVDYGINIFRPISNQFITQDNFLSTFGLAPNQFIYYKSFEGDKADNILPVKKGFGNVSIRKFLNSIQLNSGFYSLESNCQKILEAMSQDPKLNEVELQERFLLNLKLMDWRLVDFDKSTIQNLDSLLYKDISTAFDEDRVIDIINELEIKTFDGLITDKHFLSLE